jgi:hypothetical protein
MPFNEYKLLKYLYDNDNGAYHTINDILKEDAQDNIEDAKEVAVNLHLINGSMRIIMTGNAHMYNSITTGEFSIYNTPLTAKITPTGRDYYQVVYLSHDKSKQEKILNDSIIDTNKFIRYTFGAIVIGAVLQFLYIMVSIYEAEKSLSFQHSSLQKSQSSPQPVVKIYLNDSLKTTSHLK